MAGRLIKEMKELERESQQSEDPEIILKPIGDNLMQWSGRIKGPSNTPYEVCIDFFV